MRKLLRSLFITLLALAAELSAQTLPLVVPTTAECATSVDGSVVGVRNPLQVPQTSVVYTGTLSAGTYYVQITWYDAAGNETLASPEKSVQLLASGSIQVSAPADGVPAAAVSMRVYIGATSGNETLQGSALIPATYTQSSALVAGTALPSSNTTLCEVIANDAGWPTGTGYKFSLTAPSGVQQPGYPTQVQLLGPGNTINLSNGLPFYNGTVTYPIPILARPYNHGIQSISGPLSMTGYNITQIGRLGVGTAVPGWGLDVETPAGGSTLNGMINAQHGYLIDGSGGAVGQGLCSDGTSLDQLCDFVTSLPTTYYQTIEVSGTPATQRLSMNFSSRFVVTDTPSPSRTNVQLNAPGNGSYVATYGSSPGSSTNCATFDGSGNLVPSSATSCAGPMTSKTCNVNGCYRVEADGTIYEWGPSALVTGSTTTAQRLAITFPLPFTSTTHLRVQVSAASDATGDGNPHPAECHWERSTLSTSGVTSVISQSVEANASGAGYAFLAAGDYCSFWAVGD